MVRLTVLYNLPEGADENAFLEWRLGEHQQENASMEGVIRTDFARIDEQWTPDELCHLATSESWQTDEYSDEGYLALKYLFYRLMIPKDKWEAVDFNKFLSIVKLKYQERLNEEY